MYVCLCLSVFVSMSVCQLACLKTRTKLIQPNCMYTLPVSRSSSDDSCVLPILWMTSCFHTMERMGQNQRRRICFVQFARGGIWGRSLPSSTASRLELELDHALHAK